ncbi:TadE/TadG family type IV pilus assembly protein [Celeribacter sp. SCSIO 80788]|uniref:TadE/TadG family type IV pilus assembly protein n=1 Tax=Celeribacter sp. SCSIO 80788 TaxID=3117013 RepID=UPI003DA498A4
MFSIRQTSPKTAMRRLLRRFSRDDGGSVAIEALIVAPALIFSLMAFYTFFAAFEAKARANKANYTISDYISRQTDTIDDTFMGGLADLYRFLNNDGEIDMRVSAVQFVIDDDENESYELVWSYATGDYVKLTDITLTEVEERLPLMADGEEVIVVETQRGWVAPFNAILTELDFEDIVTTKPRFASQVIYDDGTEVINDATHEDSDDSDVDTGGTTTGTNTSGGGSDRHGGGGSRR